MAAWNTFIEGDNLDVLPTLGRGSVDLVYIDPPYNTGNDFAYRDSYASHAAWVAMMRPRLVAAREVLAETGAIFVSIDDNEAAYLRLLMDEVYGEGNLLAQIVVNLNPKGRQLGRGFATSHEYLLAYARDAAACVLDASSHETVNERDFPLVDGDGRHFRHLPLRNTNKKFNPATARTLHFPVWGSVTSGEVRTAPFGDAVEILPVFGDGSPAVWRWSPPRIDERGADLVCRLVRGPRGERVDVFQKDWLHTARRAAEEAAHDLAGRGGGLHRHRGRGAEGDPRARLRLPEADRAAAPDPGHHARRCGGARLLRRQRYDGARGRARERRGRRVAAVHLGELRGADAAGVAGAAGGLRDRRRHHPGPAAGRGGDGGRWARGGPSAGRAGGDLASRFPAARDGR